MASGISKHIPHNFDIGQHVCNFTQASSRLPFYVSQDQRQVLRFACWSTIDKLVGQIKGPHIANFIAVLESGVAERGYESLLQGDGEGRSWSFVVVDRDVVDAGRITSLGDPKTRFFFSYNHLASEFCSVSSSPSVRHQSAICEVECFKPMEYVRRFLLFGI